MMCGHCEVIQTVYSPVAGALLAAAPPTPLAAAPTRWVASRCSHTTAAPSTACSAASSTRFMRAPIRFVVVSSTWVAIASPHRRFVDCLDDVLVAGAAADVALEPAPDFRIGQPVAVRAEQLDAGHDHPRRAEAALERVP